MRTLLISIAMLASTNILANVECEKLEGGRWYPKNETAKMIASKLGVKTCSGKRFNEVVKQLGMTTNVVKGSSALTVEEVVEAIKSGK